MYKELDQDYTQHRLREILNETQQIAEECRRNHAKPDSPNLWESIIAQIKDIREKIASGNLPSDWEQIYERYTIGSLGLQFFQDQPEMRQRLNDIFHGTSHYYELPD
ncbi:MAG: hypothetical protein LIO91_00790 [Bacteroidales bacterium]|nr:hypothetical protein [Bacteroidales bacterium]